MSTKKVLHVDKNKMMLHQKSILCLKSLLMFFGKHVNNMYNFAKVLKVLFNNINQRMHCMMSLEGGKIRCVAFLCGRKRQEEGSYRRNNSE